MNNTTPISSTLMRLTASAVAAGGLALAGCSRADREEVKADAQTATANAQQAASEVKADATQVASEMKADVKQAGTEVKADAQQAGAEMKADARQAGAEIKADAQKAGETIRDKAQEITASAETKANAANEKMKDKASELKADAGNMVDKAKVAVADGTITASIKAEFAKDPVLKARDINVDTEQGRVSLRGTAPSAEAKAKATQLANSVSGVVSVSNQLTVSNS